MRDFRTTLGFATLGWLCLSVSALAQDACNPQFASQKQSLISETKALKRLMNQMEARLASQEFRLEGLAVGRDVSGLPKAPELRGLPEEITRAAADPAKGCSIGLEAELKSLATLRTEYQSVKSTMAERDAAMTLLEQIPPAAAPETAPASGPVVLPVPEAPGAEAAPPEPAAPVAETTPDAPPATPEAAPQAAPAPVAEDVTPDAAPAASAQNAVAAGTTAPEAPEAAAPVAETTPEIAPAADAAQVAEPVAEITPDAAPELAETAPPVVTATAPEPAPAPAAPETPVPELADAAPDSPQPAAAIPAPDAPALSEAPAELPLPLVLPSTRPEPVVLSESAPQPLTLPDAPEIFQRVLSLPEMRLADSVDANGGQQLPVFSTLYVYGTEDARGSEWLQVGADLQNGPQGWVRKADTVDWSTMLVMQFAPRGKQRNRVLFYENDGPLRDLISGPFHASGAKTLYSALSAEQEKSSTTPGYQPQWNGDLVGIEPDLALRFDDKPYLLPILDWRREMFDGVTDTTLVKVAALPAVSHTPIAARDTASFASSAAQAAQNNDEFRVGVVFVVDTTISMRPFIERTKSTIASFYDAFQRFSTTEKVSFGLTGFRADPSANPRGIGYTTRLYQPLDAGAEPSAILRNMSQMQEAAAPTRHFAEDSLAGVVDAIRDNDWTGYDARIVVLITDASALGGSASKYPDMSVQRVREMARSENITIVPVHLLTDANAKGDAEIARQQYQSLSRTGDLAQDKYLAVDAADPDHFGEIIGDMAEVIAQSVMKANAGELLVAPEPAPAPVQPAPESRLAEIVSNEIFRAQLENLSRSSTEEGAPAFLAGWAADRDLVQPEIETLEVSVYLTRNQLSTLDKRLASVIEAFRSGGQDPQTFFANLQMLAAQTATDPDRVRNDDRAVIEEILPAFLRKLPYRSEVLRLNQSYWASMSVSQQQEFIEALETRRRIYADLFEQSALWTELGSDDPGLQATPVRLTNLP